MNKNFNEIYDNALDGWGFSFRRSQIYRFQKYIDIFKKNIEEYKAKSKKQTVLYGETLFVNGIAVVEFENDTNTSN